MPPPPPTEIPTRMLVLGMVRVDGTIDAGELYAVANACGMSDQQVRLCLLRLVSDGLFERVGRGRGATFTATSRGRETIGPDVAFVRFAYLQDAGLAPWDQRWRLVGFAVPENRRSLRDTFRDRLILLGGAPIQGGLYVSPNDWLPLVQNEAADMGLADEINVVEADKLKVRGETDPSRIAAMLWPLDDVAAGWHRLVETLRRHAARLEKLDGSDEDATHSERLRMAFEIALEFNRAIEPDPLLPPSSCPIRGLARSLVPSTASCGNPSPVGRTTLRIRRSSASTEISPPSCPVHAPAPDPRLTIVRFLYDRTCHVRF